MSILASTSAARRRRKAIDWLLAHRAEQQVLVVGATLEAAGDLLREASRERPAAFGWQRFTLSRLAAALATPLLAEEGLAPVAGVSLEALCARVVHRLAAAGELGPLQAIADRPGLTRALAATAAEVRMAGAAAPSGEGVGRAIAAVGDELRAARLADRADVLRLAARAVREGRSPLAKLPLLLLDVPVTTRLEAELIAALRAQSRDVLAVVPQHDAQTLDRLQPALGAAQSDPPQLATPLQRVQAQLFAAAPQAGAGAFGGDVKILSAPGEGRECVEIARLALQLAASVPFDRMAILLRAPTAYRALLEEALGRAGIPAHFARGVSRPDPSGRAFLALLACKAQGLSAARFAEYLSLGEVPDADGGAPPPAAPRGDAWAPPGEELALGGLAVEQAETNPLAEAEAGPAADPDAAPVSAGSLRQPWRWEKLLADAAVIGGKGGVERWRRRLDGLAHELELKARAHDGEDEARAAGFRRELQHLGALRAFALPLVGELDGLPSQASWGEWLDRLAALATRALRRPDRVLSLLAELQPLAPIGPVALPEVRLALERRLGDLLVPPPQRRHGKLFVAPIDAARGLSFDVVFVPGVAEKVFPPKLHQDALLRDEVRRALSPDMRTQDDRLAQERLALRLAVGAAQKRLVLSYPRLDVQQSRPRVPSFYALEVARAADGKLPVFTDLMRAAEAASGARVGWPAPKLSRDAIDDAEHDLALLQDVLRLDDDAARGKARYLLSVNEHLKRSLQARGRRHRRKWFPTDGLVPDDKAGHAAATVAALQEHQLAARSFSPTALQHFAACPYRFVLQAIHRLAPREVPEAIDEIDPLSRGSLMHEVQFELLRGLAADGLLPLDGDRLAAAQQRLETVLDQVAAKEKEKLFPAIERVWDDCVASLRADLRRWLETMRDARWEPWHFELSFGLPRDPWKHDADSRRDSVRLDTGLQLRGSIDLVERDRDGNLRATDYKSGKQRMKEPAIIGGGKHLQPVLYALALEKLFAGTKVEEGRLYYCTHAGGFASVAVPLDADARAYAAEVALNVGDALREGFFPAAPDDRECDWCDYLPVCGPSAATLAQRKPKDRVQPLYQLRGRR